MASPPPKDAVIIWLFLIFSSSLLFLNLARVGGGGDLWEGAVTALLADPSPQGEERGALFVTSAIPNILGPVKISSHALPSSIPTCISRPLRGGHAYSLKAGKPGRAPPKRPSLSPGLGT